MKRFCKLLALVLSVACLLALVACGGATTSSQPPASQAPERSSAPDGSGGEEPAAGVSYPIEGAEGITLEYWLPIMPDAAKFVTSYNECESWQEVMARTGVNIKFIHPAISQETEQFNIMMASGELPDIIMESQYYTGGAAKGVADGVFMELTPYLEDYAPDYLAAITADDEVYRETHTEEDAVPAFYKILVDPIPPYNRPILRADWLEEFEMDPPKTLEEFETYMRLAYEEKQATAFIPVVMGKEPAMEENWTGAFDFLPEWYVVDGTVYYGKASSNLKDYLVWMNDLYQKGYVSKDFPALDLSQRRAEFDAGKVALYVDSVDNARNRTLELDLEVTSAPYPRKTATSKLHTSTADWPRDATNSAVISTSCEYPEIAVQFLNYAYTEEGAMLYNYGVEGVSYEMVDGKPKYTEYMLENPTFPTTSANYILRIHWAPKLVVGTPLEYNPTIAKSPEAVEFRMMWMDDPDVDNSYRIPPIELEPEANTRRAEIMANVNTYADEMILQFIIGAEPLDDFEQYLAQLDSFGMGEALTLTQETYDAYMSR